MNYFIIFLVFLFSDLFGQVSFRTYPAESFGLILNERNQVSNENDSLQVLDLTGDNLPELVRRSGDSLFIHLNVNGKLSAEPVYRLAIPGFIVWRSGKKFGNEQLIVNTLDKEISIDRSWFAKQVFNETIASNRNVLHQDGILDFSLVYHGPGIDSTVGNSGALADIDNDGKMEIIFDQRRVTLNSGHGDFIQIYQQEYDGSWTFDHQLILSTDYRGNKWIQNLTVDDLDNDGYKEIIFSMTNQIFVYGYLGSGNYRLYSTNIDFRYYLFGEPDIRRVLAGDFDSDGIKELAILYSSSENVSGTTLNGSVSIHKFLNKYFNKMEFGQPAWYLNEYYAYDIVAGDLDNDGYTEIVLCDVQFTWCEPTYFDYLKYIPETSTLELKFGTSGYPGGPGECLIEDVDGDGLNEMVASGPGCGNGCFFIMKASAPDQLYLVQYDTTSLDYGPLGIAGGYIDGKYSIVLSESDGSLVVSSAKLHVKQKRYGTYEDYWVSGIFDSTYTKGLFLNDTDHDGKENIIFVGYTMGIKQTDFFDLEKTTVSGLDSPRRMPTGIELKQNYPNPFNADTEIIFLSKTPDPIQLDIYSLNGRILMSRKIETVHIGENSYSFKPLTNMASGIYYYRIVQDEFLSEMRKMIYLK